MDPRPPHDADPANGREPFAATLARAEELLAQAEQRGLVRLEDGLLVHAVIGYIDRREAIRSLELGTRRKLLEFIDMARQSKEQRRVHLQAALRLAWWPGPKWRMRWDWYQMARSSTARLTALWAERSADAAVRLTKAAREAGATIVAPQDCGNWTLSFIHLCSACCDEIMQAADVEIAAALKHAVDAAMAEIAQHVQEFVAEQRRVERVWRTRNRVRV